MEADLQSHVAFFLTGKKTTSDLDAIDRLKLRPALFAGYRDLTEDEIALMNEVKTKAAEVGTLVEKLRERLPAFKMDGEPIQLGDQTLIGVSEEAYETDRWMTIGTDHLQQGFMALTRAVARPTTF